MAATTDMPAGGVAFLTPRRADNGPRDRLWRFTRKHWAFRLPEIPIIEGHDDGPGLFNRSRAMNRARTLAGDVDVLVILDADVLVDGEQVRQTIETARTSGRFTIGYEAWCGLTETGTNRVLSGYTGAWEPHIQDRYTHSVSSLVAVPAALWDEVGGFDERFQGWGLEDSAFELACSTLGGQSQRIPGVCWHLWHPRDSRAHRAEREANRRWFRPYKQARGRPERMRQVVRQAQQARVTA